MSDEKKYETTLKFLDYSGCALYEIEVKGTLKDIVKLLDEINPNISLGALMEEKEA